ncbi:flagellar rod assembly protein/muramidase FlgJ [Betaproteobacteria bacterium GR16-43]|nr:flagellar rod assembly protein/muramidase FlgJ [Betaproteobacteria bacterium GR16-43]
MATRLDNGLAADSRRLDSLKSAAGKDPKGQAKEAAKQFEAVFANLLIKSLRESLPKTSLTGGGNAETHFEGMLDQQRAQAMTSGRGLGLAPVIEKQLLRQMSAKSPADVASEAATPVKSAKAAAKYEVASLGATGETKSTGSFIDRMKEHATTAAKAIGVPPAFVLGQAALESGWGKREVGADQGVKSHNLFGIKAGANWKGATVEIPTTEYVNGVARKVTEKFRAYDSYADAFADYAKLISGSKRYTEAAKAGGDAVAFAQGLQKGGYATDPRYAEKLASVIQRLG